MCFDFYRGRGLSVPTRLFLSLTEQASQHVAEGVSEQIYCLTPEELEKDFVICQDLSVIPFHWFIPGGPVSWS